VTKQKPRISIVGLGLVGGSIGLALRQADVAEAIVGHDREASRHSQAKKLGAVDQTDWNLISACEKSDLVVLAIPVGAIESTLKAIGPYLRPGCVVMDTASVKAPVLDWAAQNLPAGVFFIGGDPILFGLPEEPSGLGAARADLFRNRAFCLTPSPQAEPAAIDLVSNLVVLLGASPLFLDAAEHDGLMAAVDHLPGILALALLETVIRQPTWRELRKMAGASFEVASRPAQLDPEGWGELFWSNRNNVVRWMDAFDSAMASIRQTLVAGDREDLIALFEGVQAERIKWLVDREQGQWETGPRAGMPERPNVLADAFLGGLWRRRPPRNS
jgi:prephenate dehydrogenase